MESSNDVYPLSITVEDSALEDLRRRLAATRWPSKETVSDWSQGVPLKWMQDLVEYWKNEYDWRAREKRIFEFDHFVTNINKVDIHFIHAPSPHNGATPVILTHGWPGSFLEFLEVIEPLRNPEKFGGSPEDAMHIVVPSLPGFGYSGKPTESGHWKVQDIADAWDVLMARLGYDRYVMCGTDWGAFISMAGATGPGADRIIGLALNGAAVDSSRYDFEPTAEEVAYHEHNARYFEWDHGYSSQQSTRPQALGYGLEDSPVGQAAWILDKFASWVDYEHDMTEVLSRDTLLDNIMIYWLNGAATSSSRIYYESFKSLFSNLDPIDNPATFTSAKDTFRFSEREIRTRFTNLRRYGKVGRGGHFVAFEQPDLFTEDLRLSIRALTENS